MRVRHEKQNNEASSTWSRRYEKKVELTLSCRASYGISQERSQNPSPTFPLGQRRRVTLFAVEASMCVTFAQH